MFWVDGEQLAEDRFGGAPVHPFLEEQIAQEKEISSLAGDLDTLFELAREGEDVSADLDREMKSFSAYLESLETKMLLSGENAAAVTNRLCPSRVATSFPVITSRRRGGWPTVMTSNVVPLGLRSNR